MFVDVPEISEKWKDFFFQAEEGIRDAQGSRGLGDVYKRQKVGQLHGFINPDYIETPYLTGKSNEVASVSYTHLTLPTINSV